MTTPTRNHFEMFGLPERYALDIATLEQAYRRAQTVIHPDRYAHAGETEQRLAMQMSAQVNEAYRILRNPVERARYLLQLRGVDAFDEADTAMPQEFLFAQMERREALSEARAANDASDLERLAREVSADCATLDRRLCELLDAQHEIDDARLAVRERRFLDKLSADIGDAIAALDH
jgi:molecular chaperone HscB